MQRKVPGAGRKGGTRYVSLEEVEGKVSLEGLEGVYSLVCQSCLESRLWGR